MSEWEKAREAAVSALKRGRGCDAGEIPCAFCKWQPDEMTAQHDETGCEWLLDAALSAFAEAGYVLVPMKASEAMVLAGTDSGITDPDGWATCAYEIEQLWPLIVAAALKERQT